MTLTDEPIVTDDHQPARSSLLPVALALLGLAVVAVAGFGAVRAHADREDARKARGTARPELARASAQTAAVDQKLQAYRKRLTETQKTVRRLTPKAAALVPQAKAAIDTQQTFAGRLAYTIGKSWRDGDFVAFALAALEYTERLPDIDRVTQDFYDANAAFKRAAEARDAP